MCPEIYVQKILFAGDQKDSPTELAFKYAVFRINKDKDVLPNNSLTYDVQYVPNEDSFRTTKKVSFFRSFWTIVHFRVIAIF